MDQPNKVSVHWSFWAIGVLALLWNLGGAANYLIQMNPEFVAGMPETHRAIILGRPVWATGGFAIGVFAGAIGALLLLLRKAMALPVFIVSLLAIVLTMVHTVNVAMNHAGFGGGEVFVMIVLPVIVAAVLIWYTLTRRNRGWID